MATLASLAIDLTANSAKLVNEIQKANGHLNGFARTGKKVGSALKVALGAVSVGAMAALTKEALATGQELEKLARVANTGLGEFQKYSVAARTLGVEQEKLSDIMKDVSDKVGDFLTTGGGPLKDFFETVAPKVGVTAEQFRNLSGPQALGLYVESLNKANLSQNEMVFFMEAIASDATALIPLYAQNNKLLNEQGELADRLKTILSDTEVKNLRDANIAVETLQGTVTDLGRSFIADLAPDIASATNKLVEFIATLASGEQSIGALEQELAALEAQRFLGRSADANRKQAEKKIELLREQITLRKALSGSEKEFEDARLIAANKILEIQTQISAIKEGGVSGRSENSRVKSLNEDLRATEDSLIKISELMSSVSGAPVVITTAGGSTSGDTEEANEKPIGADDAESALEMLESRLMTEEERLHKSFERRQEILATHLKSNKGFEERYHELSLKNLKKYNAQRERVQKRQNRFEWTEEQKKNRDLLAGTSQFFGVLGAQRKEFAIAQALINTYLGVSESLAAYPMPLAAVMAASHLASGMATVNSIRSGGGGSIPSAASAPSATLDNVDSLIDIDEDFNEEQRTTIDVNLNIDDDALLTKNQLAEIMSQINDASENRNVRIYV